MSLLPHLFLADLRRIRWLASAWTALMVSVCAVNGLLPLFSANPRFSYTAFFVFTLVWWAMVLGMLTIVPSVVQADPAVGTDAFWMTRPIPRAVLVASKLLLLMILIVLVPTATEVALMLVYRVPAGQIVRVALQTALLQMLCLAVLTIAATLTANLARFAVLCGAGLVLAAVGLGMSEAVAAARAATGEVAARLEFIAADSIPASLFVRPAFDHTAALVVAILTIASAVASIVSQYQTRLRRRSIPIGLAGLLVACGAGISWPWPLLQPNASLPDWASAPEALRLMADAKSVTTPTPPPRFKADRPQLVSTSFRVTLDALRPEWIPTATLVSASLRLSGVRLESAQMGYPLELSTGSSEEASQQIALRQALRVTRLLEPARGDRRVEALFLRDDDVQRYAPAVGQYTGRFRVGLTHPEVIAALPLKPGATGQAGALRVVVDGVSASSAGGGVRPISPPPGQVWNGMVAVRESNATSLFDRAPASNPMYFVRNSRLGEAVRASTPYDPGVAFPWTSVIHPTALPPRLFLTLSDVASSGFRARSSGISFVALTTKPTDDRDALEAWLADAELVIIRMVDAGFVDRTLDIAEFPLVLSPRAPIEQPALVVAPSR